MAKEKHTRRDPHRISVMTYMPDKLAAKVKTAIEGRMVSVKTGYGNHSDSMRKMGMSDFVIEACEKMTEDVRASRGALEWVRCKVNKNLSQKR